jgi:hypothetical protein
LVCSVEWRMSVKIYKEKYLIFEMCCMKIFLDKFLNYGKDNNS